MSDLIDRQEAINAIRPILRIWWHNEPYIRYEDVKLILEDQQPAEPEERTAKVDFSEGCAHCTACGNPLTLCDNDKYCPNCGAKMEF